MTIGIDARMLGKGFGLARYVEQLAEALNVLPHEHTFVLFVRKENKDAFVPSSEQMKIVIADIPWYSLAEQLKFPGIISSAKVDLMHFPHFNVPLLYRAPFVVTIHDLTMYHFPRPEATTRGPLVYWIKDKAHRLVVASAAKRAKHIITTSEFTKRDVHDTLGVPLEKMTTVYQAPFGEILNIKSQVTNERDHALETKPYLLYVGAAYPHKNVRGLLDAWREYIETYGGEEELLLAGKENFFYDQIKELLPEYPRVRYLGFQTDEELESLYANARAFVFPSLYEGFGIPPLEAMLRRVPVLTSNASCMPEVLGDGVLYTDPLDADMFATQIDTVLHNEDVRHELLVRSKSVAEVYSSERFGRETLTIYNCYAKYNKKCCGMYLS